MNILEKPLSDLSSWYTSEIDSIGHLAVMDNKRVQRQYATKIVDNIRLLILALKQKKPTDDVLLMIHRLELGKKHVENLYKVKNTNLTYKWSLNSRRTRRNR